MSGETCLWLLRNKITIIHSSAFVGPFKNCIHLINAQNMEHIKLSYWDVESFNYIRDDQAVGVEMKVLQPLLDLTLND